MIWKYSIKNHDLYLKIVVVKHAEQTALKQQENAVSPGAYI
jgi:hypothetical protein